MPVRNVELRMRGEVAQRNSQGSNSIQKFACRENRSGACAKYRNAKIHNLVRGVKSRPAAAKCEIVAIQKMTVYA